MNGTKAVSSDARTLRRRGGGALLLLILAALAPQTARAQQIITTVAGCRNCGDALGDGGPATQANVSSPRAVAIDSKGNFYIADAGHQRIRKVTSSTGTISTVAGNGTAGYSGDGGPATNASINDPEGVALDNHDNIYIADNSNCVVREVIASTGNIQTVVGNGTCGHSGDGGPATSAQINGARGLYVDQSGNIFVGEFASNICCIREVESATGFIRTFAGNTTGSNTCLNEGIPATQACVGDAYAITGDSSGNIFYTNGVTGQNPGGSTVREVVKASGLVQTVAGNGTDGFAGDGGPATSAELNSPRGVALDSSGNIFISDHNNVRVREVLASTGVIKTVAGNGTSCTDEPDTSNCGDGGPATDAELGPPWGDAVNPTTGSTYIATDFGLVRKVFTNSGCVPGATKIGLSRRSVTFSKQTVGTMSGPQTLTLSDTGKSALCIFNIAINGANSRDFAVSSSDCPEILHSGDHCAVQSTFDPSATGRRSASLTIIDNAAKSPQVVKLSGRGN